MATIAYLALDDINDPILTPAQSLINQQAVAQVILTRLRLFYGEWWEDLTAGLPVLQQILGQLGTQQGQAAFSLAIRRNIEGSPYVTGVVDIAYSFTDGRFSFTATANTVFGTVTISSTPGASSILGA